MDKGASQNSLPDTAEPSRPYTPSWSNRLSRWVTRLPGSSVAYYLGLGLALVFAQLTGLWAEGANPIQTFHIAQVFITGAIILMLGLLHLFDHLAANALSKIRPALLADEGEYDDLLYRLTTLPSVGALLASLVGFAVLFLGEAVGEPYWLDSLQPYPISAYFFRIIYIVCWAIFGTYIYQTLYRLYWIHRIYTQKTQINLYRKQPLYALSNLTALTAVSTPVLPIGFLLVNNVTRLSNLDPVSIIVVLSIQVIAFFSFIWPQIGIQRLQRAEKDRLLDEVNQRLEKTYLELHNRIDNGDLENSGELSVTRSMLDKELEAIKRISIWPWEPETIRWLITALVLPIGVMLLQLILQRALGF